MSTYKGDKSIEVTQKEINGILQLLDKYKILNNRRVLNKAIPDK